MHIIKSGIDDMIPQEDMRRKLARHEPLTVKLGVDPTAPDLHLGHAVPLRKLRQLQELGHQVVLIIGDGTALIGDPSGRNTTRPSLTPEQIRENAKTYVDQAYKILDPDRTELRWNSEWLLSMNLEEILKLASHFTVARTLERDDFSNRYAKQQPISLHEFFYPMMQAYDSVQVHADVELGGTDQLFNLLAGRELMEKLGMEPQVCLTLPLLEGTDGVKKMSKSYGNYIGLTDEPADMFGKVMSVPDELMVKYYRLASDLFVADIDQVEKALSDGSLHPNEAKRALARDIVTIYHGAEQAVQAEAEFDRVFKSHETPDDVEEHAVDLSEDEVYVPGILVELGMTSSSGEGRRLIDGGGVRIDGQPLEKKAYNVASSRLDGAVLQVGKRKFARIVRA